jgi:DNA polymerase-3 subunit alpha
MLLNCHSQFSFRYGTLKAIQLLELAVAMGHNTLALTDINNTSACLNFIREAQKRGVNPLLGIDFRNGVQQQFVGLARSNEGFQELNEYLSEFLHSSRPIPATAKAMKEAYIIYPFQRFAKQHLILKENEYIGIRVEDLKHLPFSLWKDREDRLVLLQPVTVHRKREMNIHRLLRAIDKNTLLSMLPKEECCRQEDKMLPREVLEKYLKDYPLILKNTREVCGSCQLNFSYKGNQKSGAVNQNKQSYTESREEDARLLRDLCYQQLSYRYPDPLAQEKNMERLERELASIREQGFESYFLINWDLLRFARKQGFFYVGRGSGANSIVAYLLQITDVDPVRLDLYFERFINPYRENPPDFDIDFSWKDRDTVIDYLFQKYGPSQQIALLATYNTFSVRSLLRELGKVFGLPKAELDTLSEGQVGTVSREDNYLELIYKYAQYMNGIPSHLSIHAGGVLISEKPLHYFSATSMPPKGYPLVQFDMVHAEDVGLYKFDILSQRGLGKVKDTLEMVVQSGKEADLDIHATERFFKDEKIKELLRTGNTIGCFYVESPAMRMLLKKLRVEEYLGLVAASSIIRPGVAKSGMMREYILRSQNQSEEWRKRTPQVMQDLMKETYGVMVYQEDVIKVAHYFAGLSLGEADVMRRGMSGKFRSRDEFARVREKFFENCRKRGYEETLIKDVWRQTESFAGYAFSKGHSASYAVESYQSLYLKAHYPMEFILGVINNGGGFYHTEIYFHEARMLGAVVEAPCINKSDRLTVLEGGNTIYMGFGLITDLEERLIGHIVKEREKGGHFTDLAHFIHRCSISIEALSLLIRVGAFRYTGMDKRQLLWEAYRLLGGQRKSLPNANLFRVEGKKYTLPPLDDLSFDEVYDQIELLGFPLCSPFDLLREELPALLAVELRDHLGREVTVAAYLVTIKNTITSKGDRMQFGTFIDRKGDWIDTVHFPPVARKSPFCGRGCYRIKGTVVEEFGYATIEVKSMERMEYMVRGDKAPEKSYF